MVPYFCTLHKLSVVGRHEPEICVLPKLRFCFYSRHPSGGCVNMVYDSRISSTTFIFCGKIYQIAVYYLSGIKAEPRMGSRYIFAHLDSRLYSQYAFTSCCSNHVRLTFLV